MLECPIPESLQPAPYGRFVRLLVALVLAFASIAGYIDSPTEFIVGHDGGASFDSL